LPVVDSEKRLVGIITVDDVVDIMRQETTEDMEKMAAILPTDKSYFRTGIFETFKNRIPWLLLLMISATFTGMIISGFENALAAQAALTAFIPMLMDTAGNSGSQSSVTVIRSLSLGDITFSDWYRVIWKELRVSLLCGLVLSVANFVKILLVDNLLMQSGLSMAVILVICLTLFFTILMAKVLGCSLPILAKKLGFDPAVMASPFITTIVDALSLLAYFGFATWILQI
ncbi:MAG: magnesium transporter, partial [Oscillospiraceae bacterium]|nr:magnesium transporter [Oscillospiraceae bacterium]